MRFQPAGNLLAAALDKTVSIFNVETDRQTYSFQVWGIPFNINLLHHCNCIDVVLIVVV